MNMLSSWLDKNKKLILILTAVLVIVILYLYILFPAIEKDFKREPIEINTNLWKNDQDKLLYYYLESHDTLSIDQLLARTSDSIFVVNYMHSHPYSVTLKNPENYLVHFTNNYTAGALLAFRIYLKTGESDFLDIFLKNAAWIVDEATIIADTIAVWQNNDMLYDKYNLDYGWPSSFSQGFALSVLTRSYQITNQDRYIKYAEMALNSFNLDYKSGGIVEQDQEGNYWYLEYPANPPGFVLNGMIFGLFGIYDYWRLTGSDKALEYFNRGIKTLKENLGLYDKGYWSAYDLLYDHFCAGFNYHKNVHIPQLDVLYQITGEPIFLKYKTKFQKYLSEPYLTVFKLSFTIDSVLRRLTYKSPLKKYFKPRFNEIHKE